eukprot:scaffold68012_cov51-Phaeocystis_antarctica.AAC.1
MAPFWRCMCDRDRGYGGCLPETPQPTVGAWRSPIHASLRQSGSFANALNTNMKNVCFGALGRGIYIRAGLGWVGWGELTGRERERRAGGKASWGWAAEGAAQCLQTSNSTVQKKNKEKNANCTPHGEPRKAELALAHSRLSPAHAVRSRGVPLRSALAHDIGHRSWPWVLDPPLLILAGCSTWRI